MTQIHYHFHYERDAIGCLIVIFIALICTVLLMIYMNREYSTDFNKNFDKGIDL